MRAAIIAVLAAMFATARAGLCEIIGRDLPSFCSCVDTSAVGATAACNVNFLHLDTIGLKAVFAPCAMPAHVGLEITEADLGIDYHIFGLTFGENEDIPVPGLSVDIPEVGNAGVQAAVELDGSVDAFEVKLGLDACISAGDRDGKICSSSLTSRLPVWVIHGNYTFGHVCRAAAAAAMPVVDPIPLTPALRGA